MKMKKIKQWEEEGLSKEDIRLIKQTVMDCRRNWREETEAQDRLECKYRPNPYEYEETDDFFDLYNYDDTDYDDGLEGMGI
ncbi:MAG: hypothetical protein ACRC7S_18575 [Cetobacterium sp.]